MVASEIKSLTTRKRTIDNKVESIKNYLSNNLQNGEKHNFPAAKISWRKSEIVDLICDVRELPGEYVRIKYEADKATIKKDLKSGKELNFATLKTKQNIQIQ